MDTNRFSILTKLNDSAADDFAIYDNDLEECVDEESDNSTDEESESSSSIDPFTPRKFLCGSSSTTSKYQSGDESNFLSHADADAAAGRMGESIQASLFALHPDSSASTLEAILTRYGIAIVQDTFQSVDTINSETMVNVLSTCLPLAKSFFLAHSVDKAIEVYNAASSFASDHYETEVVVVVIPNDKIWERIDKGWSLNLKIVLVIQNT